MFRILALPEPILRQKAKPVAEIDGETKKFADELVLFLQKGNKGRPWGVGLSAPQVGQSLRVIAIYSPKSRRYLALVNPELIWRSKRTTLGLGGDKHFLEGCLSVPGFWGKVRRSSIIKVGYQTPAGVKMVRRFRGFTAPVIQHEIDHLDGILFIDRLQEQNGRLFRLVKEADGREKMVPV